LKVVTTQGDGNIEKYRGEERASRPLGSNFQKAMLTRQYDQRTSGLQITRAASSFLFLTHSGARLTTVLFF